ncbi:MAG TPA: DUF4878 domain-containing protein [Verrucomicrobiae bacterium]|jgi:hypothetical protein
MKIKTAIVLAAVVASVGISWAIQQRADARLQKQQTALEEQTAQVTQLSEENARLKYLAARKTAPQAISAAELHELLKLRNEAGSLRDTAKEEKRLEASNAKLRTERAATDEKLAAAQASPNYWAKDKLANMGYATPEAAVESLLAAMKSGEVSDIVAHLTPEAQTSLQKEMEKHGGSAAEVEAQMKSQAASVVAAAAGFHIVDEIQSSPDVTVVNLSFDGEGVVRKFVMKRIGADWRFDDLLLAGQ